MSEYTAAKSIVLATNYRSRQRILDVAHSLIACNTGHASHHVECSDGNPGEPVRIAGFVDEDAEADYVARSILLTTEGLAPSGCAVLCRSVKQSARPLVRAFTAYGIPFSVRGYDPGVEEALEDLCAVLRCVGGAATWKSLVSSLVGRLDAELAAWRTRRLDDVLYPYLTIDARYEDVRCDGRIVSQGVLIVAGVREDGKREILSVDVADTESEATYQECFRQLKARGLQGVELVTSDDHRGLVAAVKRHFQGASWQRCQVHFARGLLGLVGVTKRAALGAGLRTVFAAQTIEEARKLATELADEWRTTHRHVAAQLDEHSEECFACYGFPPSHRVRLRTTNGVERLNEEIKRRTRVVRIFPNREACLRLATALCAEQSDDWVTGKRYLDITELRQWQRDRAPQEVALTAV